MELGGTLYCLPSLRQVRFLNDIVAQNHGCIKRLNPSGMGFKTSVLASRAVAGYEAMATVRTGQVASAPATETCVQRQTIAALFDRHNLKPSPTGVSPT
jgi:transposase-like protein